jgi:phosphoserine phosphatase
VVFFDVDGTLVPHTSSGQHLAELLGHAEVVREAEAGYAAGILSNEQVSVLDARGWAMRTPAQVRGFLESLPLVDGIAEDVGDSRSDLPLFAEVGLAVAVNATSAARAAAHASAGRTDLRSVLPLLGTWLKGPAEQVQAARATERPEHTYRYQPDGSVDAERHDADRYWDHA